MSKELTILLEGIKESGYKLTPQRREIIQVLVESRGKHLNCDEIYELVKTKCPEIGIATVYRTIQILESTNNLSRLNLDDGCVRYEINLDHEVHNHHHLICKNCGSIIEVQVDLLEELENNIEINYGFKILDHDLKFFGICNKCSSKE